MKARRCRGNPSRIGEAQELRAAAPSFGPAPAAAVC
jgi:hypothetical protein